ncbi:MAG TPA: A/G-specific adenine glycosylase [Candidatus Izemoplasmatales bacterium]|nr:A/G-specific adenine glycosylase [Candidatus Izemoplasmatales bacterium]
MNIKKLEQWYIENHRKLPFRESNDPYQIWISEIMLQQTQMDTVIPYFNRFLKTFPSVCLLAKASEEELLIHIQGLGYYRRFKNMLKAAKVIVKEYAGVFPKTHKEILKLPGIGEYTAGAIMSIAYNKPFHATDGNVIRVLSRYYLNTKNMRIEKNKKAIKLCNQKLIEKSTPSIYTQAIMELGALVCKPKKPLCKACPIQSGCLAHERNQVIHVPYLSKAKKKRTTHYKVLLIDDGQSIYLRKRTETLLGGMYEFPMVENNEKLPINYEIIEALDPVKHVFTHLVWQMSVYRVKLKQSPPQSWIKVKKDMLYQFPMATAHKKIADQL